MGWGLAHLLLFAPLTGALAYRLEGGEAQGSTQAQKLPWRKAATVGSVVAHALSAHPLPAAAAARTDDVYPDRPRGISVEYTVIRAILLRHLRDHRDIDEITVTKLVRSLRRSRFADKPFIRELSDSLESHGLHRILAPTQTSLWTKIFYPDANAPRVALEDGVEYYATYQEDGSRGVVLKRFFVDTHRTKEQIASLENSLRSIPRATNGPFLKVYAQSHTPSGVARDQDAEVLVMYEPFSATLRQYLGKRNVTLAKRLAMFSSIIEGVDTLYRKRIAHNSVICPDNILITGDLHSSKETDAVLCPSIFGTDVHICTLQERFWWFITFQNIPEDYIKPKDLLQNDIKQLGELLQYIIELPGEENNKDFQGFQALAQAMRAGAFRKIKGRNGLAESFAAVDFATTVLGMLRKHLQSLKVEVSHDSGGWSHEAKVTELQGLLYEAEEHMSDTVEYLLMAAADAIIKSEGSSAKVEMSTQIAADPLVSKREPQRRIAA